MQLQTAPRSKILIVEDDADSAEMLTAMLEDSGYIVQVARTAQAATEVLQLGPADAGTAGPTCALPPDLVLLDLQLPDQDGSAVVQRLAAAGAYIPPVVVLSAKPEGVVEDIATRLGAAMVLKPFEMNHLLGAIAASLHRPQASGDPDSREGARYAD